MQRQKIIRYGIANLKRSIVGSIPYVGEYFNKPSNISISITTECNMKCTYCYQNKTKSQNISLKSFKEKITKIQEWIGDFHLTISGGEPLLRDDLPEMISYSKKHGAIVNLLTNGSMLDDIWVKKLSDAGLDMITVSLDVLDNKNDKNLRNSAVDKIKKNILHANKTIPLRISSVITKKSIDSLTDLVYWVKNYSLNGIRLQAAIIDFFAESTEQEKAKRAFFPKEDQLEMIQKLKALKRKGYPIINSNVSLDVIYDYFKKTSYKDSDQECAFVRDTLQIKADGIVYLCRYPIGSSIEKIQKEWRSKKFRKVFKKLSKCKKPCRVLNCHKKKSLFEKVKLGIPYLR